MQAIENEPPDAALDSPWLAQCRRDGQLGTFTPAPLGPLRARFVDLVRNMQRQGEAYTTQLSFLTLAGLQRREGTEAEYAIVSQLLKGAALEEPATEDLELWQSRLLLKLGEFYDLEQAELTRALQIINQRQDALLAALCDDDDPNPFVAPAAVAAVDPATDSILRHRLRAWTRLCFRNGQTAPGLLVTCQQTALDLLQEVYEKRWQGMSESLLCLELPELQSAAGQGVAPQQLVGSDCPALATALEIVAAQGSYLPGSYKEQVVEAGKTALQSRGRGRSPGSGRPGSLELFYFAGARPAALLSLGFGAGLTHLDAGFEAPAAGGAVIGLLRQACR